MNESNSPVVSMWPTEQLTYRSPPDPESQTSPREFPFGKTNGADHSRDRFDGSVAANSSSEKLKSSMLGMTSESESIFRARFAVNAKRLSSRCSRRFRSSNSSFGT